MATINRLYSTGDIIGGAYRVIRMIQGGLGVVYAVEDREGNRLVLKGPKDQLNEEVLSHFRFEAETWVQLGHHSNIVPALWVGDVAGLLVVAAELIDADEAGCVSLRDIFRFGPLRAQTMAIWIAHFCFGMDHAHSRGLVAHRDIKPENLLVGASKSLKITDFGLANAFARRFADAEIGRVKVGDWRTLGGPLAGTPQYMAPEQWLGGKQDFRTDVYAFGVVLFEMCFGANPFDATDINKIVQKHLSIQLEVPDAMFSSIIQRCLEKNPDARFSTPQELLTALTDICKRNDVALPPRQKETDKQNDEMFALCSALQMRQEFAAAKDVVKRLIDIEPDRARNWTELGRINLRLDNPNEAKIALEKSLSLDGTRSAAWNNLGLTFKKMAKWKAAIAAFEKAVDCDPTNTGALANATDALLNDGRAGEALLWLRRATKLAPDKHITWLNLGTVLIHFGHKVEALAALNNSKALAPIEHYSLIDQNIKIAEALPNHIPVLELLENSKPEEAERKLVEDLTCEPAHISSWHNLGVVYMKQQRWGEARDCFLRVHQLDSTDGYAVCRIIELSSFLKDVSAIEQWCNILAEMPNGHIASIAFKARALANCDQYQKAKLLIFDAVKKYPDEPDILIACGDVMMWFPTVLPAIESACSTYQRAIDILRTRWDSIERQREIEGRLEIALQYRQKCREEYTNSKF